MKFVVLEHLFLPDKGLRFFTSNIDDGKDPTKLNDGRKAYKVIDYVESVEDAQKLIGATDWSVVHQGKYEFSELMSTTEFPVTVDEKTFYSRNELMNEYLPNTI